MWEFGFCSFALLLSFQQWRPRQNFQYLLLSSPSDPLGTREANGSMVTRKKYFVYLNLPVFSFVFDSGILALC